MAVTKVDQVLDQYRINPDHDNPSVKGILRKAANLFCLGPNRVFPLINYYNEKKKSFALDKSLWKLLYVATKMADSGATRNATSGIDKDLMDLINS